MEIIPLKSQKIYPHPSETLEERIHLVLKMNKEIFREGDIFVITSKILSYYENRLIELVSIRPGKRAKKMTKKMSAKAELIELALREADQVITETPWVLLTRKNGIYSANSGVDTSNVPKGYAILWPKNPFRSAQKIRNTLKKKFGLKKLATLVIDSMCIPGRKGTISVAIGFSGIKGYQDLKGKKDAFGNILRYSALNIADSLATAANVTMGEGNERQPFSIIRETHFASSRKNSKEEMIISPKDEMFPIFSV